MNLKVPELFNKEIDKVLLDINFVDGKSISKGIPWNNFTELEIQAIIKIHFETLGFNIIWRHKDDPANESGIDLECSRKADNKKIIIAVKKKPKKNDLGQVIELSQAEADQRIYVYIDGAAQSFRDQIKNFETYIEFWNEKKLEEVLNETGLTFNLKIDNSYANYAIHEINKQLKESIISKPKRKFPKPDIKILMIIWGMKDRAVTANKCAGMAQLMFEDPKRFGKISNDQIQNLVLWCLDYIFTYSLISLYDGFKSLPPELKIIFHHTYERTKVRSNWLNINSYQPGLIPENLDSIIYQNTEIKNKNIWLDESKEQEFKKAEPDYENDYFEVAANVFRCMGIWADGFEGTIDYVYQECLEELKK